MTEHVRAGTGGIEQVRRVGGFAAACLLVSNVIGSGIFTTTGFMARDLGEGWLILWCWVIGGAVALTGALCYSELGAAVPVAGGEYAYLRLAYGPLLGFLSGWASFTVGFGAAIAAGAESFAAYALRVLPVEDTNRLGEAWLAVGLVWVLTGVHAAGVGPGSLLQQTLTVLKVTAIGALIVAAFAWGEGDWAHVGQTVPGVSPRLGTVVVSLIFVSYAFSGWNAAAYIAGEIVAPARTIPRVMIGGTLLVGGVYLALNAVYLFALPVAALGDAPVLPVAEKASLALFGPAAARWITLILCVSIAGTVSAMIWAGPRVYFAMARDGVFPASLATLAGKGGAPQRSIVLQSGWATVLILSGTFEQLVIYSGVVLGIFTALAIGSVIVLRCRRPDLDRPYRVPLYPVLPGLYLLWSVVLVGYVLWERPTESLLGVATVLSGAPLYWIWTRAGRRSLPEA